MLFNRSKTIKTITPKEALENMKKDNKIMLIDVREDDEYKTGHIRNAKLIPVLEVGERIVELKVPKDTTLYIYCKSGARSSGACGILKEMGYESVYNLGGIINWPYEIVR